MVNEYTQLSLYNAEQHGPAVFLLLTTSIDGSSLLSNAYFRRFS